MWKIIDLSDDILDSLALTLTFFFLSVSLSLLPVVELPEPLSEEEEHDVAVPPHPKDHE